MTPKIPLDMGLVRMPVIRDFSAHPLIAHPAAIYAWARGVGLGGVLTGLTAKIWFRFIALTDADYADILQTVIMQNVI
jgi:hypothetical protein